MTIVTGETGFIGSCIVRILNDAGIEDIIIVNDISQTDEYFDYLWDNNFEHAKTLWNYCAEKQISFIYASSAAKFEDRKEGFDDKRDIDRFRPLNGYGYSRQFFGQWVKHQAKVSPKQHVEFKFFNVYGSNEYLKKKYQYYTKAEMDKLRETGHKKEFINFETGIRDYLHYNFENY